MPNLALPCSDTDSPVDLDDTSSCPLASTCAVCGTPRALAVTTMSCFGGVACVTLCLGCGAGPLPSLRPLDALSRCGQHAEHLGIDVDQMAALLDGAL